jgi:O-acetylserine/cysteine efflux transporter
MKPVDIFCAILVAVIWGLGFIASRLALDELSPSMMTALRFAIAAVPCLFIRKPKVSWPILIVISLTMFLFQFLAQSYGIAEGVPVGLTSVIVQSQALFTIAFAAIAFHEKPTSIQMLGIGISTIGLLMICGTVGFDFSVGAFAVLMISPVSFAIGNLLLRLAHHYRHHRHADGDHPDQAPARSHDPGLSGRRHDADRPFHRARTGDGQGEGLRRSTYRGDAACRGVPCPRG